MSLTDEFRVVTRKRRSRRGCRDVAAEANIGMPDDDEENEGASWNLVDRQEAVLRKIFEAEVELNGSPFGENVLDRLDESLNALNQSRISEIVCYGLGRFSRQTSAKYQLALLVSLKRRFGTAAYVYDPVFLRSEINLLRRLGLVPIERNEEGKRELSNGPPTLVYMPHCSTHLTNNLLYANWSPNLCNCLLLGNSLSIVTESPASALSAVLPPSMDYVSRVLPYVTEFHLRNDFSYEEAFNDFTIHAFLRQDIDSAPPEFWTLKEEPDYRNLRVEYVTAEESAAALDKNRTEAVSDRDAN